MNTEKSMNVNYAAAATKFDRQSYTVWNANDFAVDCYLEYRNEFLTVKGFSEFYGMSVNVAKALIEEGKKVCEMRAKG